MLESASPEPPPVHSADDRGSPARSASCCRAGLALALLWLGAGVAVGIASAWVMGPYLGYFPIPPLSEEAARLRSPDPFAPIPEEILPEITANLRTALLRNTAFALGICGAMSFSAFGLLYGVAARNWTAIVRGLAGGAVIGAAGGALAGALAVAVQNRFEDSGILDPVVWLSFSLAAAWVTLGLGSGALSAWVAGSRHAFPHSAFAAVAAGLIAAVVYQPTAMMLFPLERLDRIIPLLFANRAYCISLATGLIALALRRTLVQQRRCGSFLPEQPTKVISGR